MGLRTDGWLTQPSGCLFVEWLTTRRLGRIKTEKSGSRGSTSGLCAIRAQSERAGDQGPIQVTASHGRATFRIIWRRRFDAIWHRQSLTGAPRFLLINPTRACASTATLWLVDLEQRCGVSSRLFALLNTIGVISAWLLRRQSWPTSSERPREVYDGPVREVQNKVPYVSLLMKEVHHG